MQIIKFSVLFFSIFIVNCSLSQEICNNAIDDDGDGLIDLNDTLDCTCNSSVFPSSIIPNFSFENTLCCPNFFSQMHCVDDWIQPSQGTTDYYNTCGYTLINDSDFVAAQLPLPGNGAGYVGFYANSNFGTNEYVAACLNSPLIAGNSYTISFYTAVGAGLLNLDIAIFGTPNCSDLSWGTSNCPLSVASMQILDSQTIVHNTLGGWQQTILTFSPTVNINGIAIGDNCSTNSLDTLNYYYLDELVINESNLFNFILEEGSLCDSSTTLSLNAANASNIQWYKDSVALLGETFDSLNAFNYFSGNYTVTFDQSSSCKSLNYMIESASYPTASVIPVIDSLCVGENVILMGDSSLTSTSYHAWYYNLQDGSPNIYFYNLNQLYNTPGDYNIKFVAISETGCSDSIEVPITVFHLPATQLEFSIGSMTYQPVEGDTILVCGNDSLYFNNLSNVSGSSIITDYKWGFGDMDSSILENPTHRYNANGFYNLKHTIRTDKGCEAVLNFVIEIQTSPQADFIFSVSNCANDLIGFTNSSSPNIIGFITNYTWDFGDSNQSSSFEPQHQYNSSGNYNIKLIVESFVGCKDSIVKPISIQPAPISDFLISGYCQGDTIDFTDQSTVSAGTINSWQWKFGDGSSSSLKDTSHYYTTPNTYLIEFIVETDQGCKDTLDSLYTVSASPQASFMVKDYCENESIVINNNSSISSGNMNYSWVFQNNISSTFSIPPLFSYTTSGQYEASLTLTSDQGCISSLSKNLTIHPMPNAVINELPIEGCSPFPVILSNLEDQNISRCVWDFGDGTLLEECGSVNHVFQAGIHDILLTVYSPFECESSVYKNSFVSVIQSPSAAFNYQPQSVSTINNELIFSNQSSGANSFLWNFGSNLGSSTKENPILFLPRIAKTYSVTLSAFTSDGFCKDETTKIIKVADELLFYVPNSFTPDDNGFNETFTPVMTAGFDIYSYQLTIFNRWGEVLFISKDPKIGWDGTYDGESVQVGTYLWQINYYLLTTDEGRTKRGTVNLIR